jgi:3-methyladenine DNA glycosylase AlkC
MPAKSNATNNERFSLKDHLFNRSRVEYLGGLFAAVDSRFNQTGFVGQVMESLLTLELKQRIAHIAVTLQTFLDPDFRVAAKQIIAALPPPLDPNRRDDDFGDFIFAPLGEFVVRNGLHPPHLALSLETLRAITQRFSMEDSIRAFLNAFPAETMVHLQRWAQDRHYHVRRLVSEGTRPNLPWSTRLNLDPLSMLPLLDQLHADPTRYVTRSVANHLNDLAKLAPEVVLETLKRWRQWQRQAPTELQWMAKHALRTLIKRGHPPAFAFLGFDHHPPIQVQHFEILTPVVKMGDALLLELSLLAEQDADLIVDYEIDFVKAGGKRSSKVHKLKQVHLTRGESVTLRKSHGLRANATTYTLYPGAHHVSLLVNGQVLGRQSFELLPPPR